MRPAINKERRVVKANSISSASHNSRTSCGRRIAGLQFKRLSRTVLSKSLESDKKDSGADLGSIVTSSWRFQSSETSKKEKVRNSNGWAEKPKEMSPIQVQKTCEFYSLKVKRSERVIYHELLFWRELFIIWRNQKRICHRLLFVVTSLTI